MSASILPPAAIMLAATLFLLLSTSSGPLIAEKGLVVAQPSQEEEVTIPSITLHESEHGSYYRAAKPIEGDSRSKRVALVLVHGSPGEKEKAQDVALTFAERWLESALERDVVLICPVFDQHHFASKDGPGGGYRGLFGREVGADQFLIEVLEDAERDLGQLEEELLLYGHSAGGQFVSRFVVRHPRLIRAAVLSAPASFAFPDKRMEWPNGMRSVNRFLRWPGAEKDVHVKVKPKARDFLLAATKPIGVVVGLEDVDPVRAIESMPGENHVERARAWVDAMHAHAKDSRKESAVQLIEIPNVGHSSRGLTNPAMEFLFAVLEE